MKKEIYNSAMDKVTPSDEFIDNLIKIMIEKDSKTQKTKAKNSFWLKLTYQKAFISLAIIVICIFTVYRFDNIQDTKIDDIVENDKVLDNSNITDDNTISGEFKITGTQDGEASYISVVYIDGYAYSPNEWFRYSYYGYNDNTYELEEKIGEVTLDLKGLRYTGTPPDYSSTYDVGTPIYKVKGINISRAISVEILGQNMLFYRERKVAADKESIGLILNEVFQMISTGELESVELRSEMDGSFSRSTTREELLNLIKNELPSLPLLNRHEIISAIKDDASNIRVPINLIFSDGAMINMQFYPEKQTAYVFGGNVVVSKELSDLVFKFYNEGDEYLRILDLLPLKEEEVNYLFLEDLKMGISKDEKEVRWSITPLYSIFGFYSVDSSSYNNEKQLYSISIGKNKEDTITLNFYEKEDTNLLLELNGKYYSSIKGKLTYDVLNSYMNSYTN